MTTDPIQPSWVVTAPSLQDYALRTLGERFPAIFAPFFTATTRNQFQCALDDAVYEYVPIKSAIMFELLQEATPAKKTTSQIVTELNQELWNAFKGADVPLSLKDRKVLLDFLKYQVELGQMSDSLLEEAKPLCLLAIIDAYWP
ncbi:MAG: hypothetical protein EXR47_07555 [Dehalococcoidia bacterium]|nr:hypothetical protein [Dehalococcoidia bacterium]